MPRTVMVWRSELISMSLVASTSMAPLGSTPETRAVSVVEMTTSRLVVPCPASCVSPLTPARLASGPAALVMPARALTEFFVLEVRAVLVVPLVTAEALSTTRTVIMSSIWLALTSRAASARRDPGAQMPPGVAAGAAARTGARVGHIAVQRRLRRRAGFLLRGQRQRCQINRTEIRSFINFPSSRRLCLCTRRAPESAVWTPGSESGWSRPARPSASAMPSSFRCAPPRMTSTCTVSPRITALAASSHSGA